MLSLLNHMEFEYMQHRIQKGCQHTYQQERNVCSPKLWKDKQMPRLSKSASPLYPSRKQVASSGSQSLSPAMQSPTTYPSPHEIWRSEAIPFFSQFQDMLQKSMPSRTSLATAQWLQEMGTLRIQSLPRRGAGDMLSQHTSMSRGEALNRGGMPMSSTTILASWSLEGNGNCMEHPWMPEESYEIFVALVTRGLCVEGYPDPHLKVGLMQLRGARVAYLQLRIKNLEAQNWEAPEH